MWQILDCRHYQTVGFYNTLASDNLINLKALKAGEKVKRFIKAGVKKFFNTFGFEIYRRTTVPRRESLAGVLNHISRLGFNPKTVIDVGVGYGTFELYEQFPDAHYLLIEPLREFERVLRDISRRYKAEYVIAAAQDKPGTTVMNIHNRLDCSSLLKETDGSHVDGTPREVPSVTIDGLCKEKDLRGPFLIKIDVQGAELIVLNGAKETLKNSELIILEVSLFQFFVDGSELYDVVSYMKKNNFVVYDIFGGHIRPFDGALAQVDMAFVKEDGFFRRHHCYGHRRHALSEQSERE